ncbi:MAG: DNA-directed RNA polymerase subunit alpha [Elusimicrobia bacterium]|nr:DNA-directed RNA polymerase subunit alpha [Elusimicrobiota bacterium]
MPYQELVLPQKLEIIAQEQTPTCGKFIAEPFERGYGHTVGNSLRRILLSSLEGVGITAVRIQGVRHEYSYLKGVKEDVASILLNLKNIRARLFSPGPEMVSLSADKGGTVRAKQIQLNSSIQLANPDQVIATLEHGGKLEMELQFSCGRGYMTSEEVRSQEKLPSGFLPLDAMFSPVTRVHYEVEHARVGQATDYDRLVLSVWTDGTMTPREALGKAAKILRESLWIFVSEEEQRELEMQQGSLPMSVGMISEGLEAPTSVATDARLKELLQQSVDIIELSVRAANCLKMANIRVIRELVEKRDEELLAYKNFGKKSLEEIKERLRDVGLSLGMKIG